ncbi:MAG TPA: hypothetical protein VFQ15_06830, partial [Jiangellaceae bacterium]|nr:hypothetical protein [Jiangellaceae bacterium]
MLRIRVLAARNSQELNVADVSKKPGSPPARPIGFWTCWKRSTSSGESLLDTGLAARLINVSAAGAAPDANSNVAGHLLEG